MANRSSILLVSTNPELHRILELITSTYNFQCLEAETAKKGVSLLISVRPDCVIFDLGTLHGKQQRAIAQRRIEESGIPALFLNGNGNGTMNGNDLQSRSCSRAPLRMEPIVRFVIDHCHRATHKSNGGILSRFLSFCRLRRA